MPILPRTPNPMAGRPGGGVPSGLDFMARVRSVLGLKQPVGVSNLPLPTPGAEVQAGPRRTQYEVNMPDLVPRQVESPDLGVNIGIGGPAAGSPPPAQAPSSPSNGAAEQAEIDTLTGFAAGNGGGGGAINAGADDPTEPVQTLDMAGTTITASPGGLPLLWIIAGVAALYLWRKK